MESKKERLRVGLAFTGREKKKLRCRQTKRNRLKRKYHMFDLNETN